MKVLVMYPPSAGHFDDLHRAAPQTEFRVAADPQAARTEIADADAVLGNRYFLESLPFARRLRWMQSNSMGVDRILGAGAPLDGVTITCARGVYDAEMADHAVALVLALARGIAGARDAQVAKQWKRRRLRMLAGSTALVLGWGGVGRGIARRLAAFGVAVRGARRTAADGGEIDAEGFTVLGPGLWRDALPLTDWLILALPLTAATRRLVGAGELAMLREGAGVVNVGRGGTLDEDALLRALGAGVLSGAALDVLEQEPPAPQHLVWDAPGVLLTPHEGRSLEAPPYRWEPLFAENLRRFASGELLLNVVDREAGY